MAEPTLVVGSIIPGAPRAERGRPAKIDVSPQGHLLAYPSAKVVQLLSTASLEVVHVFREHRFDASAVRVSPNGELIASGDLGGGVFVWAAAPPFDTKHKHVIGYEIADIAWSPDGSKLAVVGDGRPVYFDLKTGSSAADLTCHSRRVEAIAVHPEEKERLLLMACHDSRVSVFDKSGGGYRPKYSQLLTAHVKEVYTVCFNADGSLFATGGADGRLIVYDTATKEKLAERQHERAITATVFKSLPAHDNGDTLIADVFQAEDSSRRKQLLLYASTDGTLRALRCAVDGDETEFVDEWEVKRPGSGQQLALAAASALSCAKTANCAYALSCDGTLHEFLVSDGAHSRTLHGHKGHLKAIDIEGDLVVTGDNSGRMFGHLGIRAFPYGEEAGAEKAIRGIAILEEEEAVVCLRLNNVMEFLSLHGSGTRIAAIPMPSEPRAISNGMSTVAALCHKHFVLVDRKTRDVIVEEELTSDPAAISLLADGSELAIGDITGVITVYSVTGSTLSVVRTLKTRAGGAVSALQYSSNGAHLAVADASRYVSVYRRTDDWSLVADDWRMHNASIRALGWSPNGRQLATGAVDRTLIVWRLPEEDGSKKYEPIVAKSGHIPEALFWRGVDELDTVGEDGCRIRWIIAPE